MRRRSELMQLESGMSMSRYLPAMGTAGLDRSRVRGKSRVPRPPPRITARQSCMGETGTLGNAGVKTGSGPIRGRPGGWGTTKRLRSLARAAPEVEVSFPPTRGPGDAVIRRKAHRPLTAEARSGEPGLAAPA